jgi:hypothetical protein
MTLLGIVNVSLDEVLTWFLVSGFRPALGPPDEMEAGVGRGRHRRRTAFRNLATAGDTSVSSRCGADRELVVVGADGQRCNAAYIPTERMASMVATGSYFGQSLESADVANRTCLPTQKNYDQAP